MILPVVYEPGIIDYERSEMLLCFFYFVSSASLGSHTWTRRLMYFMDEGAGWNS
jgi:hypothetical protein